jgi:hypothetical protein
LNPSDESLAKTKPLTTVRDRKMVERIKEISAMEASKIVEKIKFQITYESPNSGIISYFVNEYVVKDGFVNFIAELIGEIVESGTIHGIPILRERKYYSDVLPTQRGISGSITIIELHSKAEYTVANEGTQV